MRISDWSSDVCSSELRGQPDAFVEAYQVRRGVDLHAPACRLQHGAQEGDQRALALGARDVNDRGQASLRVAEAIKQPLDAATREVDALGVEAGKAVEDGVGGLAARGVRSGGRSGSG